MKYLPIKKYIEYISIIRKNGWKYIDSIIFPFRNINKALVIPHAGHGNPVI